ncbi:MAG: NAD-dependent epimerase/dehydratase family protein, partial [Candidatus Omnitrophota bacterium]
EDDFNFESAHVIPALIRKFDEAKKDNRPSVEVWGSGRPRREFIFADDLAGACAFVLTNYKEKGHINVGCSLDYSIKELANVISETVGFKGKIIYNTDKPDGVKQKLLDSTKINSLGWNPKVSLKQGINITYNWFKEHRGAKHQ